MTDDFKKKLLDWLSGNYTIESGDNIPQFSDVGSRTNGLSQQLSTAFPNGYTLDGITQAYSPRGDGLQYSVVYGKYYTNQAQTERKGYIFILDEDFDVLQIITSYSSGTDFGIFQKLNVGDDGNFFAVEDLGNGTKRFVMLNNIIAKLPEEENYKVILKKAYNLQGESANIFYVDILEKAPGQSRYIISGSKQFIENIVLTELVINVGMSNEWNDYLYTSPSNNWFNMADLYANWDSSGKLTFKLAGINEFLGAEPNERFKYSELSGNSDNVGTMTLTLYSPAFEGELMQSNPSIKIINENEAYIMIKLEDRYTSVAYNEIYHFLNGTITQLYKKETTPLDDDPQNRIQVALQKIGTEVFFASLYVEQTSPDETYGIETGRIIGDTIYSKVMIEGPFNVIPLDYMFYIVQKQFNLYTYYVQIGNVGGVVGRTTQIYNANDYNGQEYQALNSMVPDSAELFSGNNIVFARNLYNRIINNNTTISIINVPNSFINDIQITKENLYGETRAKLVEQNDTIETNVYEELMINFVNTLLMSNENDINNKIENFNGATRLNNSVTTTLDYDNCKITKYRINYSDDTNIVKELTNNNIVYLQNKTIYNFIIYNDESKSIDSIDFLSSDESTIFQTINCKDLEKNKCYTISQDLHVE